MNTEEQARLDRMFGVGQWVECVGCAIARDAEQDRAWHHRLFHQHEHRHIQTENVNAWPWHPIRRLRARLFHRGDPA